MSCYRSATVIALALTSFSAGAQDPSTGSGHGFPSKPIRVLVGGGSDLIIRIVGEKLAEAWRQQILVDNRPGAGGAIAAEVVARAPADGYTLLLVAPTFAINAALKIARFDHARDFAPVVQIVAKTPFVLVVHPSLPVRSVKELVALAKARPGQLNYGSPQPGGPTHLAGDLFKLMAGVDLVHVPYKGVASAVAAMLTGEVQLMFGVAPSVMPHIQSGRLRAVAVTTAERSPLAPGVPSVAEGGVNGYDVSGWNGLLAPAATPVPVVMRINAEVLKVVTREDVRGRLIAAGYLPAADNEPKQFGEFLAGELKKWSALARESKTTVN